MSFYTLLYVALLAWSVPEPTADAYAHAMAEVCVCERECIRLASYAFVESGHFAPWVLDNSCNDAEWRARQGGWIRKSCDGGRAFGAWQIHDSGLRDTTPEFQASYALTLLRINSHAWSTWRAAESHADWWMRKLVEAPRE